MAFVQNVAMCSPSRPFLPMGIIVWLTGIEALLVHGIIVAAQGPEGFILKQRHEANKRIYTVKLSETRSFALELKVRHYYVSFSETFFVPQARFICLINCLFLDVYTSVCFWNPGIAGLIWVATLTFFGVLFTQWKSYQHVMATYAFGINLAVDFFLECVFLLRGAPDIWPWSWILLLALMVLALGTFGLQPVLQPMIKREIVRICNTKGGHTKAMRKLLWRTQIFHDYLALAEYFLIVLLPIPLVLYYA